MNLTQITGPFVGSIVLAILFILMWRLYRERYLGLWAVASVLWVLRYIYAFVDGRVYLGSNDVILPLLGVVRGTFILWGGFASRGRRMSRPWLAVVGADLLFLGYESIAGAVPILGFPAVTHYTLLGISVIWAGLLFLGPRAERSAESAIVGVSLGVIGSLHLTFPFAGALGTTVGFLTSIVLNVAILAAAFGVVMFYFQRVIRERDELLQRLQVALDKALNGYLPICAHCKSIRDEVGSWHRLEEYLSNRTDAAFTHGICPTCHELHYDE